MFYNLRVPGSNPAGDTFFKIFFFSRKDKNTYIFHQNLSVDFNIFITTVRQIIVLLNKTDKIDFLQNVFLKMFFFLKNAVSEILNKFIYNITCGLSVV